MCQINFWRKKERKKERKKNNNKKLSKHNMSPKLRLGDIIIASYSKMQEAHLYAKFKGEIYTPYIGTVKFVYNEVHGTLDLSSL
jgi:hypothetical protein